MKRTPLRAGKPLARTSAPERHVPVRKRNAKRAKAVRANAFGVDGKREWLIGLPCATCGAPPPSDPSHVKARGMGGCNSGPEWMVPQCRRCHDLLDAPGWGAKRFEADYGVDLTALAAAFTARWQQEAFT